MINLLSKKIIIYGVFVIIFVIIMSLYGFFSSIKPPKIRIDYKPEEFGLKSEDITFESTDGLKLSGWFIPHNKSKDAIIVMHGYPANKADLLPVALFLNKKYNVFLFDFRSFGQSEGSYTTAGFKEVRDLEGAIKFLKEKKKIKNIGTFGFSLGGAVALMGKSKEINAIVADSAYASLDRMVKQQYRIFFFLKWPFVFLTDIYAKIFLGININDVSPLNAVKEVNVPILLIHGGKDSQIPVENSILLDENAKNSELWIIENADHGQNHALKKQEYEKRILDFFEKNLKP